MSKRSRKVAFKEEVDVAEKRQRGEDADGDEESDRSGCALFRTQACCEFSSPPLCVIESRFKAKHSLDSDEEDDVKDAEKEGLGDEDLAAQEETTIVSGFQSLTVWSLCDGPNGSHSFPPHTMDPDP